MQVHPIMLASKLGCAIRRVCAIAKKLRGILTHIIVVVVAAAAAAAAVAAAVAVIVVVVVVVVVVVDSRGKILHIVDIYTCSFFLIFSIDSQPPLSLSLFGFGEWASH